MLADPCPICFMPLMEDRNTRERVCCGCGGDGAVADDVEDIDEEVTDVINVVKLSPIIVCVFGVHHPFRSRHGHVLIILMGF